MAKAQGSTEYLVIFAAILIVALIVIYVLSAVVPFGTEANISQSQAYWKTMDPLSIEESDLRSDGTLVLVIKNNDVRTIEAVNITLGGNEYVLGANISTGDHKTFTITVQPCQSGEVVQYKDVTISYRRPMISSALLTETGSTPLMVICG